MKNTYTLRFRGQFVRQFTTVHDEQAVLLGYRRYEDGTIARKPEVLRQMKTVAALKRDGVPPRFNTYRGQAFMITVKPGDTEIVDAETVWTN